MWGRILLDNARDWLAPRAVAAGLTRKQSTSAYPLVSPSANTPIRAPTQRPIWAVNGAPAFVKLALSKLYES
jgi:hypothetical protein